MLNVPISQFHCALDGNLSLDKAKPQYPVMSSAAIGKRNVCRKFNMIRSNCN